MLSYFILVSPCLQIVCRCTLVGTVSVYLRTSLHFNLESFNTQSCHTSCDQPSIKWANFNIRSYFSCNCHHLSQLDILNHRLSYQIEQLSILTQVTISGHLDGLVQKAAMECFIMLL